MLDQHRPDLRFEELHILRRQIFGTRRFICHCRQTYQKHEAQPKRLIDHEFTRSPEKRRTDLRPHNGFTLAPEAWLAGRHGTFESPSRSVVATTNIRIVRALIISVIKRNIRDGLPFPYFYQGANSMEGFPSRQDLLLAHWRLYFSEDQPDKLLG
ncbi:MAG: hypothetical protein WAO83_19175 [Fuerstiella sp.]